MEKVNDLYIGNGILEWIKEPEPVTLKVEDLYAFYPQEYWPILDKILQDRPDLHDRIEKYKKTKFYENKSK